VDQVLASFYFGTGFDALKHAALVHQANGSLAVVLSPPNTWWPRLNDEHGQGATWPRCCLLMIYWVGGGVLDPTRLNCVALAEHSDLWWILTIGWLAYDAILQIPS
jgi:hypothetical protein